MRSIRGRGGPPVLTTSLDAAAGVPRRHRAGAGRRRVAGWRTAGASWWSPRATGRPQRLVERLSEAGLAARLRALDVAELPEPSVVHVATALIEHGFVARQQRLVVLTESDLVGQKGSTKDMRRLPSRRRNVVDPLQLRAGDYVVHEQHGVGRYVEMVQRRSRARPASTSSSSTPRRSAASPATGCSCPTDQLDQVTRYVGGEAPSLHRLGGADWAKTKGRARKAVREIAAELVRLYSARMASPGYAFGPDTPWQRELEDAFPYVETPDQLAASTRSRPTWSATSRWTG